MFSLIVGVATAPGPRSLLFASSPARDDSSPNLDVCADSNRGEICAYAYNNQHICAYAAELGEDSASYSSDEGGDTTQYMDAIRLDYCRSAAQMADAGCECEPSKFSDYSGWLQIPGLPAQTLKSNANGDASATPPKKLDGQTNEVHADLTLGTFLLRAPRLSLDQTLFMCP